MQLSILEMPRQSQAKADLAGEIYQLYPRKVARGAAIKAILKALKKVPGMTLMERVKAYAEAKKGADHQFIPHPATWFNQERWADDPTEWSVGIMKYGRPSRDEKELERITEEMRSIKANYGGMQTWAQDDLKRWPILVAKKKELKARLGL